MTHFRAALFRFRKRYISKWLAGFHVKKLMRERLP